MKKDLVIQILKGFATDSRDKTNTSIDYDRIEELADALVSSSNVIPDVSNWIQVSDKLPEPLQTVWLTNGKGWTVLGCLVEYDDQDGENYSYHWAESNGIVYEEDGCITSECESEDLDVIAWYPLPAAYSC